MKQFEKIIKHKGKTFSFSLFTDGYILQECYYLEFDNWKYIKEIHQNHQTIDVNINVWKRTEKKMESFLQEALAQIL